MKTFMANKNSIKSNWYIIDAENQVLGRLASKIANVLRGKNEIFYTPHVNHKNYVILINAKKINLTGRKIKQKIYYRHSGFHNGLKSINAEQLMKKKPNELIKKAVKGMLPHNTLGAQIFKNFFVYQNEEHKHQAQKPERLEI